MAWWAKRTKTGRIVYDKPKSPFRWKDVWRIIRKTEPPNLFRQPEFFREAFWQGRCYAALARAQTRIVGKSLLTAAGFLTGGIRGAFGGAKTAEEIITAQQWISDQFGAVEGWLNEWLSYLSFSGTSFEGLSRPRRSPDQRQ